MSDSPRITVDTLYGKMVINRHDTIRGRSLIECGKANDHPEIELLVELLKRRGKDGVAIDVGANFGCFALAFAPHCGRVIAIEPQNEVCDMLLETVALREELRTRRESKIVVYHKAAGAVPGVAHIPAPDPNAPQDFGSVRLLLAPAAELVSAGLADPTQVMTIDSIIVPDRMRVDLLKIDVEGMEMDVLLGAEETINKFHPILYVEYIHSDELALIRWIKAHGYENLRRVGNNLLADPSPVVTAFRPIVQWPDFQSIADASTSWSQAERTEWNRLSWEVHQLTVIDELQGELNRAVERVQTRIGRSLSERCPHGILLWLECGHCNTHVDGDLPTLLSPAALATLERLAESAPPGSFVEVGVFRGGSLQRLYRIAERQSDAAHQRSVFGFDTFTGLVDRSPLDIIPVGHFDAGGEEAAARIQAALPVALIVMGKFPDVLAAESMRPFDRALDQIAFAHVDVDQYASYKETLAVLWPRMVSGGIILCDDYDALHGAQAAVNESAWSLAGLRRDQIELTPEGKAVLRKP